jgi:hypothetical protein
LRDSLISVLSTSTMSGNVRHRYCLSKNSGHGRWDASDEGCH